MTNQYTDPEHLAFVISDMSCRDWEKNCLCTCCEDRRTIQFAIDARDKEIERLRAEILTAGIQYGGFPAEPVVHDVAGYYPPDEPENQP